jgi:hypothetical protein
MFTEMSNEQRPIFILRIINFFVSLLTIILILWMSIGERVLSHLCELPVFTDRRESCFRHGALEMRDRASVLILALTTFSFAFILKFEHVSRNIVKQNFWTSSIDIFSFLIIIFAIASRDFYPSFNNWSLNEFSGLGFDVAIVAFLLSFVAIYWLQNQEPNWLRPASRASRTVFSVVIYILLAACYIPELIPFGSNIGGEDTSYVYNELLATSAGNFPGSDSIPQYSSLMGIPIAIVSKLFGAAVSISILPYWLSILNLVILATLRGIWLCLFPNSTKQFVLLSICAILIARSSDTNGSFTVASFPSWTVRMSIPVAVALLLHVSISRGKAKTGYCWVLVLGVTTSFALINNIEFGLTCAISVVCAILLLSIRRQLPKKFFLIFVLGMTTTVLAIQMFYQFNGKTINPYFFLIIAREFGSNGFGSWPMPKFGFFYIVYALGGMAILFAIYRLKSLPLSSLKKYQGNLAADTALATFAGIWTLFSLIFYSARSVDGNLRVLFLPTLIAVLSAIKLITPIIVDVELKRIVKSALFPIATIFVLPMAFLIEAPDPVSNWGRVIQNTDKTSWQKTAISSKPLTIASFRLSKAESDEIGIMGTDGNAIAMLTGVQNVLAVNDLRDLIMGNEIRKEVCNKLKQSRVKLVLVEGLYDNVKDYPCTGMTNPRVQIEGNVTLFKYLVPWSD